MMYADHIPTRTTAIDNKEYLFFSGTAYLGMHGRPAFYELVKQGLQRYGTNYGASRLGNVSIPVFEQAEEKLATWLNAPAALLVSSGTLAGRLILEVLSDYQQHYAPNAHIAINPNYRTHQPHLFDSWMEQTLISIEASNVDKHLISFNSVDALTATKPSLNWIDRLPENKEIILLADDSHGIGVMGDQGTGIYKELVNKHSNTIVIASLGKAMGLPAGLIAGPSHIIRYSKSHPLFGGSSPVLPAYAYAFIHADHIYKQAYQELILNLNSFKQRLKHPDLFHFINEFPIFCTAEHELANYLEQQQIRISHFAYPSPADPLYTRVIINGLHTERDLNKLTEAINAFSQWQGDRD